MGQEGLWLTPETLNHMTIIDAASSSNRITTGHMNPDQLDDGLSTEKPIQPVMT